MKRKKKDGSAENWSYKNDYPIEEVWNTDNYLAGVIAARLKAFKALDLLKQITSFSDEEEQTIEEGLDLFRKHFRNLWD